MLRRCYLYLFAIRSGTIKLAKFGDDERQQDDSSGLGAQDARPQAHQLDARPGGRLDLARVEAALRTDEKRQRPGGSAQRPANGLGAQEAEALFSAVRSVVREAIDSGLDYARVLRVYRRELDPEGRAVRVDAVGGRDTYWVPEAQR